MNSIDLWQEKSKTCVVWVLWKLIMEKMIKYNVNCKYIPLYCYLPQRVYGMKTKSKLNPVPLYRMRTRPAWNPMPLTRRIEIICSLWHEFEVLLQGRWSNIMSTTNTINITNVSLGTFTELRQNQHGFQKLWQGELKTCSLWQECESCFLGNVHM